MAIWLFVDSKIGRRPGVVGGSFVNHTFDPHKRNAKFQKTSGFHPDGQPRWPPEKTLSMRLEELGDLVEHIHTLERVFIQATRHIHTGEEVLLNYGSGYWRNWHGEV